MADVKWIKLSTHMFDDEKIKLIEKMPDADTILVIWIKLLSQAGKTNASGYIYLSEKIPYTDEMLSAIFDRPLNTVRLALQTFEKFGMIEVTDDQYILIENWEKHQNTQGLEKIREQNRLRKQREREKKKLLQSPDNGEKSGESHVTDHVTGHVTVTDIDIDKDKDIDKEKDIEEKKDSPPYQEIISYLNDAAGRQFKASSRKTKDLINARINDGFNLDDFKRVIDVKVSQWLDDPKMDKFLRPETLFSNKFESYLNEKIKGGGPGGKTQAARAAAQEDQLGF